jgi:hypothetical protein
MNTNKFVTGNFQTYPCGDHMCARGEFPPAGWHPYANSSAFNIVVPPNPTLVSNSAAIVSQILGDLSTNKQPANLGVANDHSGGWPTYWSTSVDQWDGFGCSGGCDLSTNNVHAYVPVGAVVQDNDPNNVFHDRHMTIMDQTSNTEYDLFGVSTSPVPNYSTTIQTVWSGYTGISGGDGRAVGNAQGNDARVGNLAGRVRYEELQYAIDHDADDTQNYIKHALTIAIGCVAGTPVYPADPAHQATVVCTSTTDAPALGARLWLAMTLPQIDVLRIPAWKKVFLRTLVKYGAIINDTDTSGFYFAWQRESGNQYPSMGIPGDQEPWLLFGKTQTGIDPSTGQPYTACWSGDPSTDFGIDCSGPNNSFIGYFGSWANTAGTTHDGGIDWNTEVWQNLRVLDPCVSKGTC